MSKDYYKILGVDKKASQEEIKKAFRKLAHQHHPDKTGGDEAKFKEVNEAYQVLGNAEKRQKYDQYGTDFEQMGGFGGGAGWDDFMRAARGQAGGFANGGRSFHFGNVDLGDLFGDFFGGGSQRVSREEQRGDDIHLAIELEFEEAAKGVEKTLLLEKMVTCPQCQGNGAAKGSVLKTCNQCGGSGRVRQVQNFIFGQFATEAVCPQCHGRGQQPEKVCNQCRGRGVVRDKVNLKVKFPAGIDAGETLKLVGKGQAGEHGKAAGDLYLTVRIKEHLLWKRNGYDVFSKIKINFSQLTLGAIIKVPTLEGEVALKIPEGTASGQVFKLRGHGVKHLHNSGKGEHFVEVAVVVPKKLTRQQKMALNDLAAEGL